MAAHPRAGRLTVPLLAGAVLLVAGGCVRAELDLEIQPDDTVYGALTVAWSKEFLDRAEDDGSSSARDDLDALVDPVFEGLPEAEIEPFENDGSVGRTAFFDGRPLEEFADIGGGDWGSLGIRHDGGEYVLDGHWDFTAEDAAESGSGFGAEIVVRVAFPGEVRDHNGELDGSAVTWRMELGEDYDLHAVAAETGGTDTGLLLTAYALVVVNLGVAVALFWHLRRRRNRRPAVITTLRG